MTTVIPTPFKPPIRVVHDAIDTAKCQWLDSEGKGVPFTKSSFESIANGVNVAYGISQALDAIHAKIVAVRDASDPYVRAYGNGLVDAIRTLENHGITFVPPEQR